MIEHPSAETALAALRAKIGVTFSDNNGWLIAFDTDKPTWSFSPPDHPAHPAVAHRFVVEENGQLFVETEILCKAPKPACDQLLDDYQKLDQLMVEQMRAGK
jgi:hypothetical protein